MSGVGALEHRGREARRLPVDLPALDRGPATRLDGEQSSRIVYVTEFIV